MTVTIYINKSCYCGPYLDRNKIEKLPLVMGPDSLNKAMKDLIQSFLDSAKDLATVISAIREGNGHSDVYVHFGDAKFAVTLPHLTKYGTFWNYFNQFGRKIKCCPNFVTERALAKACDKCLSIQETQLTQCKTLANISQTSSVPNSSPCGTKLGSPNYIPTNSAKETNTANSNFCHTITSASKLNTTSQNPHKNFPISSTLTNTFPPKVKKKRISIRGGDSISPIVPNTLYQTSPGLPKVRKIHQANMVTQTSQTTDIVQSRPTSNGEPSKVTRPNQDLASSLKKKINGGKRPVPSDPYKWNIEDVINYLNAADPTLNVHADVFRKHVS